MTERDALLAAVIADPDADLPRLVYADWCDDHGDPDRAEFVRVGCALWRWAVAAGLDVWGHLPDIIRAVTAAPLAGRWEQLYRRHHLAWRAEWPTGKGADLYPSPLARGLPDMLSASSDATAAAFWPTAVTCAPVQRLVLVKVHGAKRLPRLPGRDRLRSVEIHRITDALAAELFLRGAAFDHLAGLTIRCDDWDRGTLRGLIAKFGPRFHKV